MKIEATAYLGDLSGELVFHTKSLSLHSRMQQLSEDELDRFKNDMRRLVGSILDYTNDNTVDKK